MNPNARRYWDEREIKDELRMIVEFIIPFGKVQETKKLSKDSFFVVGAEGLEPPTSSV